MRTYKQITALFIALMTGVFAFAAIDVNLQMQLGNPSSATSNPNSHTHFLIQRPQYALDYNDTTREPNWVAWDLTSADIGSSGRSNFIVDTTLPASFYEVLTTDYSGSGYDRGHMCPSADRTVTVADNQQVFYMSNMIPQAPDNNQGVWANFESYCRTLANSGSELLIIAGPSGFAGSTIASGVAIPGYTWKIAVVVPPGSSTALSRITTDTRVIAIRIPNVAGVRNDPWQNYITSAAQIEADTGYSFFTALPTAVANALRVKVDGQSATGAPVITSQPTSQTTAVGGSATFTVNVTGNAPFSFQWLKDDVEIPSATDATLNLSNVQAADMGNYYVVATNSVGSTTSNVAALIITGLPPTITTAPASETALAGTNATFSIIAGGSPPFTYQWRKDTVAIASATNATLTLANVQSVDVASYDVVVTNSNGSITSSAAMLTVNPAAPTISAQPVSRSVSGGTTVLFSVTASGSASLSYQWRKNGTNLANGGVVSGATTATLTLTAVTSADSGNYDVVISNTLGSATSTTAALAVNAATIIWDFTTANPTSGLPADITGGAVTQNNNNGTTTMLTTTSASSGYSGASGTSNAGAATINGALNKTTSTYFAFTLTPAAGEKLQITGISFGTRSTTTGAQAYSIFTSFDNYTTAVVTGTISNNSAWSLKTSAFTAVTGTLSAPITVRIYGHNGSVAVANTAVWRIDDLKVNVNTLTGTVPVAPAVTGTSPVTGTLGVAVSTPITITFNEPVNVGSNWFIITSAASGPIAATVTGGPTVYTLTPPASFAFGDTIAVKLAATQVTDKDTGTLTLPADYNFSFGTGLPVAPTVVTSPLSQVVADGSDASFTVVANGTAPLVYQWRKGGVPITGNASATTATLTLPGVSPASAGSYDVVITNAGGSATSAAATLGVTLVAPTITTQPDSRIATVGGSATFSVTAAGSSPSTYQWRKNGSPLADGGSVAGALTATLSLSGVTAVDAATYDVVVTNAVGTVTSAPATFGVTTATLNSIYWDFTTAAPTSGLPAELTDGTLTQGNNNGTTALLTTTSASSGYAGVSGGSNAGAAARVGALNQSAGGSAYFEWTLTPATGRQIIATGLSFGSRSTSTGPQAFAIYTSVDNFTAPVASGTFSANSIWRLLAPAFTGVRGASGVAVTFRLFGYNGTGTPGTGTANWRIDDLKLTAGTELPPAVTSTSPAAGTSGVPLNSAVSVTFNQPVNVSNAWFAVTSTANGPVPVVVSGGPSTFTFTPTSALSSSDTITVSLVAALITDATGTLKMQSDAAFSFQMAIAPAVVNPPQSVTVTAFDDASFTLTASGTAPLGYQWRKGGMNIAGNPSATTANLLLPHVVTSDAGNYDCVVTNVAGSVTSPAATLTVNKVSASVALANLTATYDGSAKSASASTVPAGLGVALTYDGSATAPMNAGTYAVLATVVDANYAGSVTRSLVIDRASATVALGDLNQTYTGSARVVSVTTSPANLPVTVSYNGNTAAPVNAGSYAVAATVNNPNYIGSAAGILVVAKASATVGLDNLAQTFDGSPKSVSATTTPAGLTVLLTYDGNTAAPTNAGAYTVVGTVSSNNYTGSATAILTVNKAAGTVALTGLEQAYDGTPKSVSTTTNPVGMNVTVTYDGSATPPTNPGAYAVLAVIANPNYAGSASGTLVVSVTALVRHAPTISGALDGSLQMLAPENVAINGSAWISGDLLVAGTPSVQLNGHPTYGGTVDGSGLTTLSNYTITLGGSALVRHVVRRTDAIALPTIVAPPTPSGTRDVTLNSGSDTAGDFSTVRNLTLNGNAGAVTVPAGTYGNLAANGNSSLVLGVVDAPEPATYNLQALALNGNSQLKIVGPVVITIANNATFNAPVGDAAHPGWLKLAVYVGGLTLNGGSSFAGNVVAPSGTVTLNGNSTFRGHIIADRLTINGNGALIEPAP